MTLFSRKSLFAGLAALALGACGNDSNGPSIPAVPSGLTVAPVNGTTAHISWSASSGASSYSLQRALKSAPTVYTDIGGAITGTSYDDATLALPVTEYAYRVAATNAAGTSAFSTAVIFSAGVLTGDITTDVTLFANTLYTLSGYVKVQNGATLTIQAGTRIIGDTLVPGSSLWILRGAKIQANGTAAAPIVFTSGRLPGNRKPGDWGGIIIIGNGIINRTGSPIQTEGGAAGESENYAGGTDNNDNSGTLRYVRIEFAGYDV
ncbi:MAG: Fibronectin type domain protein, partial [Gemmatimonadetes bacterium]|nr:Fibronectin type domain protein [Gemmatimonadota bacterium]